MSQVNNSNQEEVNELLALVGHLLEYRWLIIAITTLFFIGGVAFALLSTPIYQASALIQVEERKSGLAGIDVMDDIFAGKSQIGTEIGILKSRSLIGQTVDNLGLTIITQPERFPIIGNYIARRFSATANQPYGSPLLGLQRYDWGGSQIAVSHLELPRSLRGESLYIVAGDKGYFTLQTANSILLEGKIGELLAVDDFEIKVDVLNARPKTQFLVRKIDRRSATAVLQGNLQATEQGKMSGLMGLSFQHPNPDVAVEVLNEVTRTYVRQNIERASAEATNSLEFLRQQMPIIREDMEQAERRLNDYQISAKSIDINSETQAILNQLVKIEAELSEVSLKQTEMDQLFTASHPTYQTFVNKKNILLESKRDLESRISNLPDLQQELLRLKRDVIVSSEIYTLLLQKTQELDIARASTVGNVRIIDKAESAIRPVKPKKQLIVLVATLLGGMLSVGLALLHSMFNQGVRRAEEIEELGLSVHASIPFSELQIDTRGKAKVTNIPILSERHPEELAVEAFRSLRTSLHFILPKASNKIVSITGPSPKIGKSFVAANMATTHAQAGMKVLLIDADMRKGHLHYYFNNKNTQGLSAILAGHSSLEQVLQPTHIENLDFIPRGVIPPNPSGLLLSQDFEQLLDKLNAEYDLIIIDAPPVLAVSDALIIAKSAGSNMLVVRFDENPAGEVKAAIKQFETSGLTLTGAIFNAVRRVAGSSYKYGYYNYQYSYQSDKK